MNPVPNIVDIGNQGAPGLQHLLSVLSAEARTAQVEQLMRDVERLMQDMEQRPTDSEAVLDEIPHWEHWGLNE